LSIQICRTILYVNKNSSKQNSKKNVYLTVTNINNTNFANFLENLNFAFLRTNRMHKYIHNDNRICNILNMKFFSSIINNILIFLKINLPTHINYTLKKLYFFKNY